MDFNADYHSEMEYAISRFSSIKISELSKVVLPNIREVFVIGTIILGLSFALTRFDDVGTDTEEVGLMDLDGDVD